MIYDKKEMKILIKEDKAVNRRKRTQILLSVFRHLQYHNCNRNKLFSRLFLYFYRVIKEIVFGKHLDIPMQVQIGGGLHLPHDNGIFITSKATIGKNVTIFQQVTIGISGTKKNEKIIIGDNCVIGAGAKIIGLVKIGDNVKIGANAVVTKDIPSYCTCIEFNKILKKQV